MPTKINLTIPPESPTVFSNYAVVQNTPTEIIIRFCLIDPARGQRVPKGGKSEELAEVEAPAATSVFLPMSIAEGLVKAMNVQLAQVKKQKGKAGGNGK